MANLKTLQPFKSGNDPRRNTKGRPKGANHFQEMVRKFLDQKVIVNGEEITNEDALVLRLYHSAKSGKPWVYKMIMEYVYGKPKGYCPRCDMNENHN